VLFGLQTKDEAQQKEIRIEGFSWCKRWFGTQKYNQKKKGGYVTFPSKIAKFHSTIPV
jgi:hypothetical protein